MKIKTSELSALALDLMVAKCEGIETSEYHEFNNEPYMPSVDWAQGGPIIEREMLCLSVTGSVGSSIRRWRCGTHMGYEQFGPTPLIAAMRCYVASKLGDEVEVHHAST
jgi:hypothetical protein